MKAREFQAENPGAPLPERLAQVLKHVIKISRIQKARKND